MRRPYSFIFLIFVLALAQTPSWALDAAPTEAPPQKSAKAGPNLIHFGDKLDIQVYREKDISGIFTVNASGSISYPILGDVYVEGLSLEGLKSLLVEKLGKDFLVDPKIDIEFVESSNKSIVVLGQVAKPGNYTLTPGLTLVHLISQVGGFTVQAASNNVKVVRDIGGKKTPMQVDVSKVMRGEAQDLELASGDMIFVDKDENMGMSVSILGQIVKPGNYSLTPDLTLIRLISQAGGFTNLAAPNSVKIVRVGKDKKRFTMYVNVDAILDGKTEDVKLEAEDLVFVPESFF